MMPECARGLDAFDPSFTRARFEPSLPLPTMLPTPRRPHTLLEIHFSLDCTRDC